MPVGKTSAPPRQLVFLIVATILGVAAMVFLITRTTQLAQSGQVQLNIGDEIFAPGNVDRLADDLATTGPLLFTDPAGRDRDIMLQHLGAEENTGWFAFAVRPIDAPRDCQIVWESDQELFSYTCGDQTFPADGTGLFQYPVDIDAEGDIAIDLNAAERASTTTTEGP